MKINLNSCWFVTHTNNFLLRHHSDLKMNRQIHPGKAGFTRVIKKFIGEKQGEHNNTNKAATASHRKLACDSLLVPHLHITPEASCHCDTAGIEGVNGPIWNTQVLSTSRTALQACIVRLLGHAQHLPLPLSHLQLRPLLVPVQLQLTPQLEPLRRAYLTIPTTTGIGTTPMEMLLGLHLGTTPATVVVRTAVHHLPHHRRHLRL